MAGAETHGETGNRPVARQGVKQIPGSPTYRLPRLPSMAWDSTRLPLSAAESDEDSVSVFIVPVVLSSMPSSNFISFTLNKLTRKCYLKLK